ncbi:kelch-like protein 38 [Diadema setosum]|uniref:kelch-like protein 38 n=1 Tax=Diadema setosum TaxID=31175 RepID=UPI003B3A152F
MAEGSSEIDGGSICPPISDFEMDMMRMEQMACFLEEEGDGSLNLFSDTSAADSLDLPNPLNRLYWNEPRYDRSQVPSILVSGIGDDDRSESSSLSRGGVSSIRPLAPAVVEQQQDGAGKPPGARSKLERSESIESQPSGLAESVGSGAAMARSGFRRSVSCESSSSLGGTRDNSEASYSSSLHRHRPVMHPHHALELMAALNDMRLAGDMIDLKILSADQKFQCHRAIVAAGSPLVMNLLEQQHIKLRKKSDKLVVDHIRADYVGQIIEFVYTSKMGIGYQNAQDMLTLCFGQSAFLNKSVELACSDFLVGQFCLDAGSETSSLSAVPSSILSGEEDTSSCGTECSFKEHNYPLEVLHVLNEHRRSRRFTDLILTVESISFHCHRAVMIAVSPYFRAMFTSGMKEFREEEVELKGIHSDIFSILLDFIYTCRLNINEDNAQELLETASFLQLVPAVNACSQFFKDQLDIHNCLGIINFAKLYSCDQLFDRTFMFILTYFKDIMLTEDYPHLSADDLASFIADDRLNVKNEEVAFEAAMQWLKHDVDERLPSMPKVLRHVRLPLIEPDYVEQYIKGDPVLQGDAACQALIGESQLLRERGASSHHVDDPRLKLRYSMTTEVLVTVGGFDDRQRWVRDVWCFNPKDNSWHSLAPFPGKNRRFAAVAMDNDIYIIGGQADHGDRMSETLPDVWRYDSITNRWSQVASLNMPRFSHGAGVVDGFIYVVGGKMGWARRFNDVERYDPAKNTWTLITRIKGSYLEKPVVSSHEGKLYVNGYFFRDPDIMHCYDPEENKWIQMFSFQRMQGDGIENAVVVDDYVYYLVFRGYDNYVVVVNPVTGEKIRENKMIDGKYLYSYGATVVGDKIYIAGGSKLDASVNVPHLFCYDPALDLWSVVGMLPSPLCEHGCVTIEKYMPLKHT